MIILLNGAFGVGKTTVARVMVSRLDRAVLFDPEIIGIALQRTLRLGGRAVYDFQDLPLWRRLTVAGLRATRFAFTNVVVPMAISNPMYLDEIRGGILPLRCGGVSLLSSRAGRRGSSPTVRARR